MVGSDGLESWVGLLPTIALYLTKHIKAEYYFTKDKGDEGKVEI